MSMAVELHEREFDPAALLAQFSSELDDEGTVVSFTGRARSRAKDGGDIEALILEKYRGVTLASMRAIAEEAHTRFPISRSYVVHRAGRILHGEPIVFVATASAHRRAAFEAADYMMDRLKTEAVFWKREEREAGSSWIEPTDQDHLDNARWDRRASEELCRESMKV